MSYGLVKVAAAIPHVKVADCQYNKDRHLALIHKAVQREVAVLAFPELSITGYTCADLFTQEFLLDQAQHALQELLEETASLEVVLILGAPVMVNQHVYNAAIVAHKGRILGVVPKTFLPNYGEFYESRWFTSAQQTTQQEIVFAGQCCSFGTDLIFEQGDLKIAIELCEDLWVPISPSSEAALAGANLLINLSATNELVGKNRYLRQLIEQQSARTMSAYLYASAGFGESTTDLIFAGNALLAEQGKIIQSSQRFSFEEQLVVGDIDLQLMKHARRRSSTFFTHHPAKPFRTVAISTPLSGKVNVLERAIDPRPFIPSQELMDEQCEEIFNIQVNGLAQRLVHTYTKHVVLGISGGLDSTLALLVCVKTFDKLGIDRKQIVGVTMPGFGTTDRTYQNALEMMRRLGVTIREVSIKAACIQHFEDLGIDASVHDVTYENSQARERTQILMDMANQVNGMVVGTGDLSELALGWATYNGDQMSMYNVNGSVAKTLVQHLVRWVADHQMDEPTAAILHDVVDTPISPELTPANEQGEIAQKTEDLVGPYELHDFFLYNFLYHGFAPAKIYYLANQVFAGSYDEATIKKWLYTFFRRFFMQQFKRSCMPDGPKVGDVSLSPRGDWRMPSDATSASWLREIEAL